MPGMRLASTDGAGWTVDAVDLTLTGKGPAADGCSEPGRPEPVGDGPQLCVRRNGYVIAYCAHPGDLAALGVDLSRMAVVYRWLLRTAQGPGASACTLLPYS